MLYVCRECNDQKDTSETVLLKCKHNFCLLCFEKYLIEKLAKTIYCPSRNCNVEIEECHIQEILSGHHLLNYNNICMEGLPDVHTCLLKECGNLVRVAENVQSYTCKECSLWNCLQCSATHRNMSCQAYKRMGPAKASKFSKTEMDDALKKLQSKKKAALIELAKIDLFVNDAVFECLTCLKCIRKGKGIKLRSCLHCICRQCLIELITHSNTMPVKCHDSDCTFPIEDREVKSILSKEQYRLYEARGLIKCRAEDPNIYQCRQANCEFCFVLQNEVTFKCPKCKSTNCVPCKAVHPRETCNAYQSRISDLTTAMNESVRYGEYMRCPLCDNNVTKSRGCNWIRCSRCSLELCWIMKMRRWGPKGPGDTSGGCKCEKNKRCHPDCTGCSPHK